jgi:cell division protein FtsB
MKEFFIFVALAVGLNGCAGMQTKDHGLAFNKSQGKKLDLAKRLIAENKASSATETLVGICSTKGVPGVTDEALFRLALLYLGTGQGKNEVAQAQQTLEKLQKEYPSSSWKTHAASLTGLIATLNRKIRYLKGENVSLSRENRELRLNIEKLKILDMEQELKDKR